MATKGIFIPLCLKKTHPIPAETLKLSPSTIQTCHHSSKTFVKSVRPSPLTAVYSHKFRWKFTRFTKPWSNSLQRNHPSLLFFFLTSKCYWQHRSSAPASAFSMTTTTLSSSFSTISGVLLCVLYPLLVENEKFKVPSTLSSRNIRRVSNITAPTSLQQQREEKVRMAVFVKLFQQPVRFQKRLNFQQARTDIQTDEGVNGIIMLFHPAGQI